MRAGLRARASVIAGLMTCGFALAACGSDSAPLGTTQWQVSSVYDGTDRPTELTPTQQGRTFLVFGDSSFTGASGCLARRGDVEWNKDTPEVSISNFSSELIDRGEDSSVQCLPADEDTAERLQKALDNSTVSISRPTETSLRLQQIHADQPDWQTAPSVEFISGP